MVTPRIIIHGGAGNVSPRLPSSTLISLTPLQITRDNLPPTQYAAYRTSLLRILTSSHAFLTSTDQETGRPRTALDAAVHAVSLLELDPLFNCGHGAVFTNQGTNELEASVMVSRGHRKRGAAVSMLRRVKSPITLAATLLKKGDEEDAGGAQGHVHISGPECERLAGEWSLDLVDPSYFWTRKRWEQHKKGIEGIEPPPEEDKPGKGGDSKEQLSQASISKRPDGTEWPEDDPHWDGKEYIPRGTVGCVVLDSDGVLAVATSTGGLTNKLSGRIGDTPSFGAGFWAEEWADTASLALPQVAQGAASIPAAVSSWLPGSPIAALTSKLAHTSVLRPIHDCFVASQSTPQSSSIPVACLDEKYPAHPTTRGVALGGASHYRPT